MVGNFHEQNWSYPPSMFLLMAPFGFLSFKAALALWEAGSVSALISILYRIVPNRTALLLIMTSPAAVLTIILGQSSFLTTALLIFIFSRLNKNPVLAGLLIGCLTLKPQIGVLLPVVLIAARRWRVIITASITTLSIVALTSLLFGANVWVQFYNLGMPVQTNLVLKPDTTLLSQMPTMFSFMRLLGFGVPSSLMVQGLFSVLAASLAYWAFSRYPHADKKLLLAIFSHVRLWPHPIYCRMTFCH